MDIENQSSTITDAGAPFDHPDADVILRSADNVDFRVFKLLLSLASPFFKDMFALPQTMEGDNSNKLKESLPVIQVTEEKKALDMLLSTCYPMAVVDPPDLETIDEVHLLLETAIKYNVERVEKRVRRWLVGPRFLDSDPLRVFAIACRYRLEAEARLAAKATFLKPLLKGAYAVELELITGGQLYQLWQYHQSCLEAAKKISTDFSWIDQTSFCWFSCGYCSRRNVKVGPGGRSLGVDIWWYNYMHGVAEALENQTWDEKTRTDLMDTALQEAGNCRGSTGGGARARAEMREFRDILMTKIDEIISKIPLDLHF